MKTDQPSSPPVAWGASSAQARGPVVGAVSDGAHRNVIGAHSGSYALYRALADKRIGGAIIDIIQFPEGARTGSVDANTIWWLGFAEGPGTSVFTIIGVLFYMRYRIDRQRHAQITEALAERNAIGAIGRENQ